MSYLQEMNQNPTPSMLGYIGAAVAGIVFNIIFSLVNNGLLMEAIIVTIGYITTQIFLDNRCAKLNCKKSCYFNEFWHTLNSLIEKRVNTISQIIKL